MSVDASSGSFNYNGLVDVGGVIATEVFNNSFDEVALHDNVIDDSIYKVDLDITFSVSANVNYFLRETFISYGDVPLVYSLYPDSGSANLPVQSLSRSISVYLDSDQINGHRFKVNYRFLNSSIDDFNYSLNFTYDVTNVELLSSVDADSYQSGYDAGYVAGSESGYGSGYSDGYASGEADGSQKGYNSGFQAGVDSVDTQSYYDAGYQAGYAVAYNSGYEDGYDEGYSVAMERIDHWGADTSDYPLLIQKKSYNRQLFSVSVYDSSPFEYVQKRVTDLDINIDPNHTYKFVIDIIGFDPFNAHCTNISRNFYFEVGGTEYLVWSDNFISNNYFYVPGYRMSDTVGLVYSAINVFLGDEYDVASNGCYLTYDFYLYDCGPSGDTQNHIANQTDQMMNSEAENTGEYNNANDDFNDKVNDAQDVEHSLTDQAFSDVGNAADEFFQQPTTDILAGAAFYSACVTGLYNNLGDFKYIIFTCMMFIILRFIFRKVKAG